jgi:hypothetical protein
MHHDGHVGSLETGLCRQLGIEHPVFSVGFGAGARAELVAAAGRPPPGERPGEGTSIGRLWTGESCSVVDDVKPPGQIVRELVRVAEAALADAEQLA